MLCSGELSSWAGRILESLGDSTTATGVVSNWLKNNLGYLNLTLETEFYLSGDSCIEPEMSQNVSGLYSEMYFCYWLAKQAIVNLGASSYDWTEIEGESQGKIRRVSKNETAKTYRALSKDCKESLDQLIQWYNESGGASPSQTLYGQRFGGSNYDLLPPPQWISSYNFIW